MGLQGLPERLTRAAEIWRSTLESYVEPEMDEGVRRDLVAFVDRRRTELGD